MKPERPKSFQIGPYVARRDPGPSLVWRVFRDSKLVYSVHDNLKQAMDWVERELDKQERLRRLQIGL